MLLTLLHITFPFVATCKHIRHIPHYAAVSFHFWRRLVFSPAIARCSLQDYSKRKVKLQNSYDRTFSGYWRHWWLFICSTKINSQHNEWAHEVSWKKFGEGLQTAVIIDCVTRHSKFQLDNSVKACWQILSCFLWRERPSYESLIIQRFIDTITVSQCN